MQMEVSKLNRKITAAMGWFLEGFDLIYRKSTILSKIKAGQQGVDDLLVLMRWACLKVIHFLLFPV